MERFLHRSYIVLPWKYRKGKTQMEIQKSINQTYEMNPWLSHKIPLQ